MGPAEIFVERVEVQLESRVCLVENLRTEGWWRRGEQRNDEVKTWPWIDHRTGAKRREPGVSRDLRMRTAGLLVRGDEAVETDCY